MDLDVTTSLDFEQFANIYRKQSDDAELEQMAQDILTMTGETGHEDDLAAFLETLPGYLVCAEPAVLRTYALGQGILNLSNGTELEEALGRLSVWDEVADDLRERNISTFYHGREFFWLS